MNNIKGFSIKTKKAGRKWAKYFVKRHPKIIVKKAKNLSSARAMCANEINVKNWFKEYEKVIADLNIISPEQIWSGDETGVQNVPKEEFVLAQKRISANQIVSGEQGETSTILTFVNGVGDVCPPMVIQKGDRVQQYWTSFKTWCYSGCHSKGLHNQTQISLVWYQICEILESKK